MCTWVESVWSVQSVPFDRGGVCSICRSVHLWRDRVCTICMICTYSLVGVIDLQDLYNLQDRYDLSESNMCDLYYLFTGMGYVWSGWYYAHFYRWVCMICRICLICGIFVWSGGSLKSGYFALVCIMFSRDGSVWGGYFTRVYLGGICVICTSLPGWMWLICRICMIYIVSGIYMCDLDDLHTLTEMRSVRFAGSLWYPGFLYHLEDL